MCSIYSGDHCCLKKYLIYMFVLPKANMIYLQCKGKSENKIKVLLFREKFVEDVTICDQTTTQEQLYCDSMEYIPPLLNIKMPINL